MGKIGVLQSVLDALTSDFVDTKNNNGAGDLKSANILSLNMQEDVAVKSCFVL